MTESRYPGLEQANGDHRDSFATRFANLPRGYDPGAQPEVGAGGLGLPTNGSVGNGANGYDPAATQFSYGPLDDPPTATASPAPAVTGPDSGATRAIGPDSGAGYHGPDSGATRAVSPSDYSGYDLSKIGGTATYGGSAGSGSTPAGTSSYASGSGYSGSMTGYDPANYPPPTSYGQSYSDDGSTYRVGRDGSVKKLGVDTHTGLPPATGVGPTTGLGSATTVGPAPRSALSSTPSRGGPRRARLQLKHIDPWTTMKFSLVMSVALFVVWMIAIGLLYGVLGGLGVWDKINNLYDQVAGGNLISASFVLGSAAVVGAINIVLFTALATVGAFVYNLSSDLVGGIELTLSERD